MNQKGFSNTLIIILALVITAVVVGYFVFFQKQETAPTTTNTPTSSAPKNIQTTATSVSGLPMDLNALYKEWIHSYEEENDPTIAIYRPKDSRSWPPSRFRGEYRFQENGSCSWLTLAPNDAHYITNGICDYPENGGNVITIHKTSGEKVYELTILELSDSILKIKK